MSGRIRTIKPELLDDEDAAGLSDAAWRLWVGSWVLCDDHGSCRAGTKYLAAQIWQDTARADQVDVTLGELVRVGKVTVYETGGQRYLRVNGWAKHQRVDNAGKPRVPQLGDVAGYPDIRVTSHGELAGTAGYPGVTATNNRALADSFSEPCREPRQLAESLDTLPLRAQSGGEDHRPPISDHRPPTTEPAAIAADTVAPLALPPSASENSKPEPEPSKAKPQSKPRAPRATRVPDDFVPSPSTLEHFRSQGWDPLPSVAEFLDHWRAVPGAKGVKLDWEATFRNRMRDLIAWGRAVEWSGPTTPTAAARRLRDVPTAEELAAVDRAAVQRTLAERVGALTAKMAPTLPLLPEEVGQ